MDFIDQYIMTISSVTDTSASSAKRTHIDEAIAVLRQTNDGDDLAPKDLALVQLVVNSGLDALNDAGRVRWNKLIEDTLSGAYQQAWFHDVENLTRDHQGYVKWRDQVVEHYSFSAGRLAHEEVSAKRLGAVCRRLERDGIEPTGRAVMAMFDRLRTAGELGDAIPRFAVVMFLNRVDRIDLRVKQLSGTTDEQISNEVAAVLEDARQVAAAVGENEVRPSVMTVVTSEDYDNVVAAVTGHVAWARRVSGGAWSECMPDEPRKSLATLEAICSRSSLATKEQIEIAYLGEAFPDPDEEHPHSAERPQG